MGKKRAGIAVVLMLLAIASIGAWNARGRTPGPQPPVDPGVAGRQSRSDTDESPATPSQENARPHSLFIGWQTCEEFPTGLAQFQTVFWEPDDTLSLRGLIRETDLVHAKSVLEIGTGTGLVALCCLKAGAESVVATDINPHAIECARYNASRFPFGDGLEVRLVSSDDSSAFAVIREDERFDLIISNPPWEDGTVESVDQYALYDPGFELLKSLFVGMRQHLRPGGRVLLAYGCVEAIRVMARLADEHRVEMRILDERELDDLPANFLPGMLVELKPHP